MIAIIDYGMGNIKAFANIYRRLQIDHRIVSDAQGLMDADGLILPGVGAFDHAMGKLNDSGLRDCLDQQVLEKNKPVLGICVGMQMLAKSSDEGKLRGLGWVEGEVKKLVLSEDTGRMPLPHMGWNQVRQTRDSVIFDNIENEGRFYFLHSYYFECNNRDDSIASAHYGHDFTCLVNSGNVFGIQCHPEKSHSNGVSLLENFARISHAAI